MTLSGDGAFDCFDEPPDRRNKNIFFKSLIINNIEKIWKKNENLLWNITKKQYFCRTIHIRAIYV